MQDHAWWKRVAYSGKNTDRGRIQTDRYCLQRRGSPQTEIWIQNKQHSRDS